MNMRWAIALFLILQSQTVFAHPLKINIRDKASLQRGAKLFMNYCSGCHSLTYLRYSRMAEGLWLTAFGSSAGGNLLRNNLIFTQAQIHDPIRIALPPEDAKQWFGVIPPDLSLITREKGVNWVFRYLNSFYPDDSRPFGTNNRLVPGVAMPDVLEGNGQRLNSEAEGNLEDLLTFLAYVGEPEQELRYTLGCVVLGFLFFLLLAVWSLKRLYWQKIAIK